MKSFRMIVMIVLQCFVMYLYTQSYMIRGHQMILCFSYHPYYLISRQMGIQGLLKFLSPVVIKEHISSFANQTAVIDIMSWLYKGCYRCAYELNQNIQSNDFLYFILEMLDLLAYYRIKPICVFDGRYISKKEATLEKRKKLKEDNKKRGLAFLKIGNEQQARKYLSRCIIIDDRIITVTMRALFSKNIEFIVSPYESDSQMAKLVKLGIADVVITEDSDLIIYGVNAIVKLNQDGDCDYFNLSKWGPEDVDSIFLKQFLRMDYVKRLQSAILAGTDYNSSVKGIGIRKAIKLLSIQKTMDKAIQNLRKNKSFMDKVPENYEKVALQTKIIFLFATTFNPLQDRLQKLNPQFQKEYEMIPQEEIKRIAGEYYAYNADIKEGRLSLKSNEKRQIYKIEFKNVFSVNPSTLHSKEVDNRERRLQSFIQKKSRMEQIEEVIQNGGKVADNFHDKIPIKRQTQQKPEKAPKIQLTNEEKRIASQENKKERIQRFSEFKSLLSCIENEIEIQSDSGDDNLSEDSQLFEEQLRKQQNTATKFETKEDYQQDQQEQSSLSSLSFLNPFAKINYETYEKI